MASGYNYGYLKGVEDNSNDMTISMKYRIYTDSDVQEYVSNVKYPQGLGAVAFKESGGNLTELKTLSSVVTAKRVDAVEEGRIMVDGNIYKLSDDVFIVDTSDMINYKTVSIKELSSMNGAHVTLYSDKSASDNGVIRVIKIH